MCQKAYFSFNLLQKENQIEKYEKMEEKYVKAAQIQDKNENNRLIAQSQMTSSQGAIEKLETPLETVQQPQVACGSTKDLPALEINTVLDASVHMGHDSKMQSQSLLTNPDSIEDEAGLRKVIEDLRWKLDYEKKIGKQMVELLEKRVATLMAQINNLQEDAQEQKVKLDAQDEEIDTNQKKIVSLSEQVRLKTIDNEKLNFKMKETTENVVSKTDYERIITELNLAQS